jgi:ABC-type phosphate/phosphonate transport system substrate-binding protein
LSPVPTKLLAVALGTSLLLAPALAIAAAPAPPTRTRRLAVVPFFSPELMWRLYAPLVDHLSRETGETWTLVLPASHAAFDDAVCGGTVDVALVGPAPLARLNRRCALLPFLVALGPDGRADYHSMLVTASPEVTSVAALRGKRIAFFKGSTAAHVVPAKLLADAGLGPGSYQPLFLESQDRVMTAVLTGKAAGGGVKSALYRRFAGEPSLRLLQTSGALPNFAFGALPATPKAVRERVSAALLRLHPRESPVDAGRVKDWGDEIKNGFVTPPPGFLDAALELLKSSESPPRATP